MVLQHLLDVGVVTLVEATIPASASHHTNWLDKPMRGRAGLTSPDALEVLTWLEPTKARTMRRDVGKLLDRVAFAVRNRDIVELREQSSDDGVPFQGWALGLGNPREARAAAGFREFEVSTVRYHVATWDPATERCGGPGMCPQCIRAEYPACVSVDVPALFANSSCDGRAGALVGGADYAAVAGSAKARTPRVSWLSISVSRASSVWAIDASSQVSPHESQTVTGTPVTTATCPFFSSTYGLVAGTRSPLPQILQLMTHLSFA